MGLILCTIHVNPAPTSYGPHCRPTDHLRRRDLQVPLHAFLLVSPFLDWLSSPSQSFHAHVDRPCPFLAEKMDIIPHITLCLTIALGISIVFAGFAAFFTLVYIAGYYLGALCSHIHLMVTRPATSNKHTTKSPDRRIPSYPASIDHRNSSGAKLARALGGFLRYIFCFMALGVELLVEGQKGAAGDSWGVGRLVAVSIRACVDGHVALVLFRGMRYLGCGLLG